MFVFLGNPGRLQKNEGKKSWISKKKTISFFQPIKISNVRVLSNYFPKPRPIEEKYQRQGRHKCYPLFLKYYDYAIQVSYTHKKMYIKL